MTAPMGEEKDKSKYNKTMFNALRLPIVAYTLLAVGYIARSGVRWFEWHPICMMLGFVAMGANASLIKKVGG